MAALAAGALSQVSVQSTTATVSSAVATGGTGPYTYQWYRSNLTGFVAGPGNLISGATSLTLNDSGLIPNTTYFYKVIATDSTLATATSSQLALSLTLPPSLSQNSFVQPNFLGVVDLRFNMNTVAAQIDVSASTNLYYWGQAVKIVPNTAGGLPKVIGCTLKTDQVFGFINFDIKTIAFGAGMNCEVSLWGNVMYLYSTGAITQGQPVYLDVTSVGGVQATGATATMVGTAIDGAAAAGVLIRVMFVPNPTFIQA